MPSLKSGFKFLDRGFQEALVLVAGWATDYRIFDGLKLDYNYILPIKIDPFTFVIKLSEFLGQRPIGKVSLLGWSLGGFLAVEFALKNPGRVDEVILVGIRRRYAPQELEAVKEKIAKNRRGFLLKFYQACFSGGAKAVLSRFKKNLLKEYLKTLSPEELTASLDYLSRASINAESLARIRKVRIFHGLNDAVAPIKEAEGLKVELPGIGFVRLPQAGHAAFSSPDFKERFENG